MSNEQKLTPEKIFHILDFTLLGKKPGFSLRYLHSRPRGYYLISERFKAIIAYDGSATIAARLFNAADKTVERDIVKLLEEQSRDIALNAPYELITSMAVKTKGLTGCDPKDLLIYIRAWRDANNNEVSKDEVNEFGD